MTVDVNVHISRWPFRRLKGDQTSELVDILRGHGIKQAWAGSFDALLHQDIAGVNGRLAEECARTGGFLRPFGVVHPGLPDWREDLRRCHEVHAMPGIRLYPGFHGYTLDQPMFADLLREAAERQLVVQIAVQLEDERTQHPLVRIPRIDLAALPAAISSLPRLRLILLNAATLRPFDTARRLAAAGQVYFDIATLEGVGGVLRLIEAISVPRVLFGSHSPFFASASAMLKIREAALPRAQQDAVLFGNASRLLPN